MRFTPVALTIALPFVLLSACSNEPDAQTADGASDPASEQALNGDLMTDPDMAANNEGDAALSGSGDGSVPTINTSPEAIAAARSLSTRQHQGSGRNGRRRMCAARRQLPLARPARRGAGVL